MLFELRNVDIIGLCNIIFIYDNEFAADLFAAGRKMPKLVIVNTHLIIIIRTNTRDPTNTVFVLVGILVFEG